MQRARKRIATIIINEKFKLINLTYKIGDIYDIAGIEKLIICRYLAIFNILSDFQYSDIYY